MSARNPAGTPGFALHLHAHLPYVRHRDAGTFAEDWLFEALVECYVPLLASWKHLADEGIPFHIHLSMTPTLLAMIEDPVIGIRFEKYITDRLSLLEDEANRGVPEIAEAITLYRRRLTLARRVWDGAEGDITRLVRELTASGHLTLLASAATHALLPVLATDEMRRLQIALGIAEHVRAFGDRPAGFWLPECGYGAGVDAALADEGIKYTILEAHGIAGGLPGGTPAGEAISCPNGVVAFPRDGELSGKVWNREGGYPGDGRYRDFYRDLGYDDPARAARILDGFDAPRPTGLKFHRITSVEIPSAKKEPYSPREARLATQYHAAHFLDCIKTRSSELAKQSPGSIPLAAFDAELFGHWWFEGPWFLESVIRAAHLSEIEMHSLDAARRRAPARVVRPSPSSWGSGGYFETWIDPANDWMYPALHRIERGLARDLRGPARNDAPNLVPAVRELMLAQASDWAFLIKAGNVAEYARSRFLEHEGEAVYLAESRDPEDPRPFLFPELAAVLERVRREWNVRQFAGR